MAMRPWLADQILANYQFLATFIVRVASIQMAD